MPSYEVVLGSSGQNGNVQRSEFSSIKAWPAKRSEMKGRVSSNGIHSEKPYSFHPELEREILQAPTQEIGEFESPKPAWVVEAMWQEGNRERAGKERDGAAIKQGQADLQRDRAKFVRDKEDFQRTWKSKMDQMNSFAEDLKMGQEALKKVQEDLKMGQENLKMGQSQLKHDQAQLKHDQAQLKHDQRQLAKTQADFQQTHKAAMDRMNSLTEDLERGQSQLKSDQAKLASDQALLVQERRTFRTEKEAVEKTQRHEWVRIKRKQKDLEHREDGNKRVENVVELQLLVVERAQKTEELTKKSAFGYRVRNFRYGEEAHYVAVERELK